MISYIYNLYIYMYGIIAAHGIVTSHSWYHYGLWILKDIDIHVITYIIGIVDSITYWDYDIPIYGISGIIVIVMTIVVIIIPVWKNMFTIIIPVIIPVLLYHYYAIIIYRRAYIVGIFDGI